MELGYRLTPDERDNIRAQFSYLGYYFQRFWHFLFSILLLYGILVIVLRILRFPFRLLFRKKVVAQIRQISIEPSLGASWFWWTYVTLYIPSDNEGGSGPHRKQSKAKKHKPGKDVKLKLYPGQAVRFIIKQTHKEGDKGQLRYFGKRMLDWKTLVPRESERFQVFLSYPHEKKSEAAFITDLLNREMLHVWMDTNKLMAGDSLPGKVGNEISKSYCFIPLLCPEYVSSDWCLKELKAASERYPNTIIRPIRLDKAHFFIPEFVQRCLEKAGEPVFANINEQSGLDEVRQLARRIYTEARDH